MSDLQNIYSVKQLNAYIKNMFMQDYFLQRVLVRGEISNCKYHPSGHIYFTLKDPLATIKCVMFSSRRTGLNFRLESGQQVVVSGSVEVYEKGGDYQLYANSITLDGVGALYERYEKLKRDLEEMGLFSEEYKQPIPKYIKTLGVVTADTGAAVRDIIQIATRRNPFVQIILYPAIVQGEAAAPSIVEGIRTLEEIGVDVMIVGRGGGSIEDLWAFNEEIVAQAVFNCHVPIISAVGHETDTTIIDYVSDLRAPTPSAAAELAVADIREIDAKIEDYRMILQNLMFGKVDRMRDKVAAFEKQLTILSPLSKIRSYRMRSVALEERLESRMQAILQARKHKLYLYAEKLEGYSPIKRLQSGFSYVEDENGDNVRSVSQVKKDQDLTIRVSDGQILTKVTGIKKEKANGR